MTLPKNVAMLKMDVSYQEHEKLVGAKAVNLKYISRKCDVQITVPKGNSRNPRYKRNLVKVLGNPKKLSPSINLIRATSYLVVKVPIYESCSSEKIISIVQFIDKECKLTCQLQQDENRKWMFIKACKKDPKFIKSIVNYLLDIFSPKDRRVILPIDVTPSKMRILKERLSKSAIFDLYSDVSIEFPDVNCGKDVIDLTLKNSTVFLHGPIESCNKVKEEVQKCLPVEIHFDIVRKSLFSTNLIMELEKEYSVKINQRDGRRMILKGVEGEIDKLARVMELLIERTDMKVDVTSNTLDKNNMVNHRLLDRSVSTSDDRSAQFFKTMNELSAEIDGLSSQNENFKESKYLLSSEFPIDCSSSQMDYFKELKEQDSLSKDINGSFEFPISVFISLGHVVDADFDDLLSS